jgi:hypothetical protein
LALSSDIATQTNVGVQGNRGRAEESLNPTFLTPERTSIAHFVGLPGSPENRYYSNPRLLGEDSEINGNALS